MLNQGANVAVKSPRQDLVVTEVGTYLPNALRGGHVERAVKSRSQLPDLFLNRNLLKDGNPFVSRVAIKEGIVARNPKCLIGGEGHVSNISERLAIRSNEGLGIFIGKHVIESLSEIRHEHIAVGSGIDHIVPACKLVPGPLAEFCSIVSEESRRGADPKETVGVLRITGERLDRQPAVAIEHAIQAFFRAAFISSEQKKHDQQARSKLLLISELNPPITSHSEHGVARSLEM